MKIEKLTRRAVDVDPEAARYFTKETHLLQDWGDKMVDLILNGPTLNGFNKDEVRAMLRQTYAALKRFERIGPFATPFANDPPAIVAMAFAELYPDKEFEAQILPDIRDEDGVQVCGCTTFSTDPGELPLVEISGQLPLVHVPEILAHELAHVAVGEVEEHGPEWEAAFAAINEKYDEIAVAMFGPLEEPDQPAVSVTPHKVGDGGVLALPLRSNVPEPARDDWKLTTCPICGAECWESDIAREAMAAEPKLSAACTACALKAGLNREQEPERKCYNCEQFFRSTFCGYDSCNCKIHGSLDVDQHERHPDTEAARCKDYTPRKEAPAK